MNYGKIWENDFKKALGQTCIRLYDTTNGYAGVKNPCDFVYYLYPYYYLFELKSTQGDSLPFSNITDNQYNAMEYFAKQYGTNPCIAVQFRKSKECYIIPFNVIQRMKQAGEKSINVITCREDKDVFIIPCKYKITHCDINVTEFKNVLYNIALTKHKEG